MKKREQFGATESLESEDKENELERKKAEYRKIIGLPEGENPDLVLVLDAGIAERRVGDEVRFSPTSYEDETGNFSEQAVSDSAKYNLRETSRGNLLVGAGGGKARALAGRNLLEVFQKTDIVTDSRYPVRESNHPEFPADHSQIYKDYLEEKGIEGNRIEEEKESTTTFEGLINFLIMAMENNSQHLVVVTNDYHLPRTEKILELLTDQEKIQKLKYIIERMPKEYQDKLGAKIEQGDNGEVNLSFGDKSFFEKLKAISAHVASAEAILAYENSHYQALFAKAKETDAYKKRVTLEEKGILQLEEGIYGRQRKE
ncbi:MAG: YdcF family protein [Candidatus Staskawiczbacteria bacterium]|jgi:hypothetical protein